ncbi:glycoside hydrolase family 3 C-terminal domain-containing protein [Actinomadura macrotermitis]|uniref:Thermostable beta-glucosidase B n=1 Tax=Actinomadura macrotermitis TaxID=2585200 RepID=A0A7K0C3Q8_9ACTN|nr:glycoside hydrolase family 3 C-terminal domain-containing protein [Actinomadura macrotermitis]MQY08075.1 Thermostable beta-glucosidase B [Actinomadura macrotermitis]
MLLPCLVPAGSATSAGPCAVTAGRPWCDRALPADRRAGLLVAALRGGEKLDLLAGDDLTGPTRAADDAAFRAGTVHGVERLGVPPLYLVDAGSMGVKQGPGTALASGLSLAATFDAGAAGRAAGVVADEAGRRGDDVVLGPAVDIMRTPRAGRAFEAYGEDPLLSARLGTAWIEAVQRTGLMAEVKHFPANNQEDGRYSVNAVVGQRALREIYLPPFEAAIRDGKAASVMCGYNLVNGEPSCSSTGLLDGVLRKEWGFQGFVVSDWLLAAKETRGSIKAGLDLEMPVGLYYTPFLLRVALTLGRITWADVDRRLTERLRVMFAFGAFDRARRSEAAGIDYAAHAQTARQLSEQGITLLKNADGVLPLAGDAKVAVIGKPADRFRSATGSAYVKPVSVVTGRQGITARAGAGNVTYADGTDLAAAARAARAAKTAVVFVSDHRAEGADVRCLTLRCGDESLGDQDRLVTAVAAANPDTVVVLQTGGPVLMPWAAKVRGIVEAWYPGEQGGAALARVLYGDADPGGRLPVSFPAREQDAPAAGGSAVLGRVAYSEGVLVGYRHYDAKNITPAFPFGYGLSYTTFKLTGLKASRSQVSVTVTNTGTRRGYATPQLYLGLPGTPKAPQPPRQLKGFAKLDLAPGRSARVTFPLDTRAFSYWDEAASGWKVAPGCTKVMVGSSSRDIALGGTLC